MPSPALHYSPPGTHPPAPRCGAAGARRFAPSADRVTCRRCLRLAPRIHPPQLRPGAGFISRSGSAYRVVNVRLSAGFVDLERASMWTGFGLVSMRLAEVMRRLRSGEWSSAST